MRLAAVCVVLAACVRPDSGIPLKRWPSNSYPIPLMVSDEVSECQLGAVISAVDWLENVVDHDLFQVRLVSWDDPSMGNDVLFGEISIRPVESFWDNPDKLGEASTVFFEQDSTMIFGSKIRIRGCSDWVVAHELGHALGLDHYDDITNLMYRISLNGWILTDWQIDRITP